MKLSILVVFLVVLTPNLFADKFSKLMEQGDKFTASGNYQKALEAYQKAFAEAHYRGNKFRSSYAIGVTHERLGLDREALNDYMTSYDQFPFATWGRDQKGDGPLTKMLAIFTKLGDQTGVEWVNYTNGLHQELARLQSEFVTTHGGGADQADAYGQVTRRFCEQHNDQVCISYENFIDNSLRELESDDAQMAAVGSGTALDAINETLRQQMAADQARMASTVATLQQQRSAQQSAAAEQRAAAEQPIDAQQQATQLAQRSVSSQGAQKPSISNVPSANNCLIRTVDYLQSVSITNHCTESVDLTWCSRKHNSGEQYACRQVVNLGPNHSIETDGCYQCAFDTVFLAYPSSAHVTLPTEAEMRAKSSQPTEGPQYSPTSGSNMPDAAAMTPRRWKFLNPDQNRHAIWLEMRGDPGDGTDRCNERGDYINSVRLQPGESVVTACNKYYGVCYRWRREDISEYSNPGWSGAMCTESNPIWTRSGNVREIDFPRE